MSYYFSNETAYSSGPRRFDYLSTDFYFFTRIAKIGSGFINCFFLLDEGFILSQLESLTIGPLVWGGTFKNLLIESATLATYLLTKGNNLEKLIKFWL